MRASWTIALACVAAGCLVEKETAPGFCGPDVKCAEGYTCSEQSGPTWRRCICNSPACADGGTDAAGDSRDVPVESGDTRDAPAGGEPPRDVAPDLGPACSSAKDCSAGKPWCSPTGDCVECLGDMHCKDAASSFCVGGGCVGCAMAPAGACAMRSAATPACGPAGTCVECVASADCASDGMKPICEGTKCVRCSSDAQCAAKSGGPGICMTHQDGRCASDAETIYVQNKAGCAMAAPGGTPALPFCGAQAAIDQVTTGKRVIVVTGPAAAGGFQWSGGGAQVTVVGKGGAVLAGGGPVVRVAGGDLFMRNVSVTSGADTGVVAETGATLRLHESTVDGNAKGGIRTTGSAFEIVNCIITNNDQGFVGPTPFGGAYLGASVSGPRVFEFDTLVSNKGTGVACESAAQVVAALLLWKNAVADAANCTLTLSKTSSDPDPMLTPTYRLQEKSPCRNAVMPVPADAPSIDIDGTPRPQEAVFDCGASEYVKP